MAECSETGKSVTLLSIYPSMHCTQPLVRCIGSICCTGCIGSIDCTGCIGSNGFVRNGVHHWRKKGKKEE